MSEGLQISKIINDCQTLPIIQKGICFVGNGVTGRTTLAQLIKRYVYQIVDKQLIFQKDKYLLEGTIWTKGAKLQTLSPQIYQQSQQAAQIKIIDVPAFILAPENKRWTTLQQNVLGLFLLRKIKSIGIVLFIEQKNTRAKLQNWKKMFYNIIDYFKIHEQGLMNCIGVMVTKASPEITTQTIVKRLKALQTLLEKEKSINSDKTSEIISKVIEQQRIYIFSKVTNDKEEQENIKSVYQKLSGLPLYPLREQILNEYKIKEEDKKPALEYWYNIQAKLNYAVPYIQFFLLSPRSKQEVAELKSKTLKQPDTKMQISPQIAQLLNANHPDSYLSLIKVYTRLLNLIVEWQSMEEDEKEQDNKVQKKIALLNSIIASMASSGLFEPNQSNLHLFQSIHEYISFFEVQHLEQLVSIDGVFTIIAKLASPDLRTNIQSNLKNAFKKGMDQSYYENIIFCLSSLKKQISPQIQSVIDNCRFQLLKYEDSTKAFRTLSKIFTENQNNLPKKRQILQILADKFKQQKQEEIALQLYKSLNMEQQYIDCYQSIVREAGNVKIAEKFIKDLTKLCLFEKSKQMCYRCASIYPVQRQAFGRLLQEVHKQQRSCNSSQNLSYNSLLQPKSELSITSEQVSIYIERAIENIKTKSKSKEARQ